MEKIQLLAKLGAYQTAVDSSLQTLKDQQIMARIWQHDYTVWRPDPTEIENRLGWLHLAETMQPEIGRINQFAADVQAAGFTHVLLLGMGGSSLAPELFAKTFGHAKALQLAIVDTTDPDAILAYTEQFPLAHTLFIVATKSGGTVETLSAFKYFYNQIKQLAPEKVSGQQFVAITDPGSQLEKLAQTYEFRATFLNDPNIGGRYSALSHFGLLPAALVGVDIELLLSRTAVAAQSAQAAHLGVILGELAKAGRDKLSLILPAELASFGDWVEQLVAESTGKDGVGILPVVGETVADPAVYGNDRLFIYLYLPHNYEFDTYLHALEQAGHPIVQIGLNDLYDLGGQFLLWELATAVAGHLLGIQPFDQPNVEAAKLLAREMVATYQAVGQLPKIGSVMPTAVNLRNFLNQVNPGDYVALQAYVPASPEVEAALQKLRHQIRQQYQVATTVGYGPRFLHSTGQLHKGDGGNGLFIQFTNDPINDQPIPNVAGEPESDMSFGVLKMSQALGDGQALVEAHRRFIRFHLGQNVVAGLEQLWQ